VGESVEVPDGRTVFVSADLRLGESQPGAKKLLGDAVVPKAGRERVVSAVCAGKAADVLGGKGVPERGSVPKGG
jgi:hypothetical protein